MGNVEKLLNWTSVNISTHFEQVLPNGVVLNDFNDVPLELMLRGMGSCDRGAWVAAVLALYGGYDGRVVYLYANPAAISSHTVAEVKMDGARHVIDPINNRIYKSGVLELSAHDAQFKNCVVHLNTLEAQSLLPVMFLVEMICRFYIPDQILFFDIEAQMQKLVGDILPETVPRKNVADMSGVILTKVIQGRDVMIAPYAFSVRRWDYPFWFRAYYHEGMFQFWKDHDYPFMRNLHDARMKQLLGLYGEAEQAFEGFGEMGHIDQEETAYFLILNAYFRRQRSLLEKRIRTFREKYPNSPRNNSVLERLGERRF